MVNHALAPGLLLASARLGDPNFEHTVVLLARHDEEGALGWVVNGRALPPVRELLEGSGLVPSGVKLPSTRAFDLPARVGGPVSPATGWILFRRETAPELPGALDIGRELAVTGDVEALAMVLRGEGPEDFRLLLGYAGWGPDQLEGEVGAGAWLPADVDAGLVFETPSDALWDAAYRDTIGAAPAAFMGAHRGSA